MKAENLQGSFFISGKTLKEHVLLDVNKIHYILAATQIDVLLPSVLKCMDYYRVQNTNIPITIRFFMSMHLAIDLTAKKQFL